jgi:N12 class adenine-specific DNA methylase
MAQKALAIVSVEPLEDEPKDPNTYTQYGGFSPLPASRESGKLKPLGIVSVEPLEDEEPPSTVSSGPSTYVAAKASGQFSPEELETIWQSQPTQTTQSPTYVLPKPQPYVEQPGRLGSAKTGGAAIQPPRGQGFLDVIPEGVGQFAHGAVESVSHPRVLPTEPHLLQPPRPGDNAAALNAASDMMEGVAKMATPLAITGAIVDFPVTAAAIGAAWLAGSAAEQAAQYAGADPATQRFYRNLTGTAVATLGVKRVYDGLADVAGKTAEAVQSTARAGVLRGTLDVAAIRGQVQQGAGLSTTFGRTPQTFSEEINQPAVGETAGELISSTPVADWVREQVRTQADMREQFEQGTATPETPTPPPAVQNPVTRILDETLGTPAPVTPTVDIPVTPPFKPAFQLGVDETGTVPTIRVPPTLPQGLAGAAPRFNIGSTQYTPVFESDLDKAALILAQKTPSKRDADYLDFVMRHTGTDEAGARALGQQVKTAVKEAVKDQPEGEVPIPNILWNAQPPAAAPTPETASAPETAPIPSQPPGTEAPAAPKFTDAFTIVGQRKVGGGAKTFPADEYTWKGEFEGVPVTMVTRPRTIVEGEGFLTSGNMRLRDSKVGDGGHFVDAVVDGDLTTEQLTRLQEFMEGSGDERPIRVRRKGEPLGRSGVLGGEIDLSTPTEREGTAPSPGETAAVQKPAEAVPTPAPVATPADRGDEFAARYTEAAYNGLAGFFKLIKLQPPPFADVRDGYAQYLREQEKPEATVQDFARMLAEGKAEAQVPLRRARATQAAPAEAALQTEAPTEPHPTRLMGIPVTHVETIKDREGVHAELYNSPTQRGVIRIMDHDSGELVSLKSYPTFADAQTIFENMRQSVAGRVRRNAINSNALEDALSPEAQATLGHWFKQRNKSRDLRHVREAMEVYQRLLEMDTPEAHADAKTLRDVVDAFFRNPTHDGAGEVDAAAHTGLQRITGEEDPDPANLLENEVFASAAEAGRLIFDTLNPRTAAFDSEEFNTAFGMVEFRKPQADVFPVPTDTVRILVTDDAPPLIAPAAGQTPESWRELSAPIIQSWKDEAARIGREEDHSRQVVISLFDRTGEWSKPYADAGYHVMRYDIENGKDLMDFGSWMGDIEEIISEGYDVVAVLAAPPCTSFAVSGNATWLTHHGSANEAMVKKSYGEWAAKMFDTPVDYANHLVAVVKLVVEQANPKVYAMENPVGRIAKQNQLPKYTLFFDPNAYGDPYTKRTQLWGEFNPHLPTARVGGSKEDGGEGSKIHEQMTGYTKEDQLERSVTPEGFAYAFFMANHDFPLSIAGSEPYDEGDVDTEEEEGAPAPIIQGKVDTDAGRQPTKRNGPGQLPVSEGGAPVAGGTGSPSVLGTVPPASQPATQPTLPPGPTDGHPQGVVGPGIPDRLNAGAEPQNAPTPGAGAVEPGPALPTPGSTHDPGPAPLDYTLSAARIADIIAGGTMTRARNNLAAITLVKILLAEQRHATLDEQHVLARYVGFGDTTVADFLAETEDYSWRETESQLWRDYQTATTPQERRALADSSTNAHFTYQLFEPMWEALVNAGFTGGRVLEPSVGTGHAFGFMPGDVRGNSTLNGVELEPLTAAIAAALYPSANVQVRGYEQSRIARGSQDLIIGNPPFSQEGVDDPLMPELVRKPIHNYFFGKALEHVRPGGLVAFITSRYTMDNQSTAFRQYLMERAHFVGAVRLPNTSFDKSAKTQVVTDLIILQRLQPGETARNADLFINAPRSATFSTTYTTGYGKKQKTVEQNVYRSAWYDAHPELVLGTETLEGSMYRDKEYTVTAARDGVIDAMRTGLAQILPPGTYQPASEIAAETPASRVVEGPYKPGELRVDGTKIVRVARGGEVTDVTPKADKKNSFDRIKHMIGIRDALRSTIQTMRDPQATNTQVEQAQLVLAKAYSAFVRQYGRLNDLTNKRLFTSDPEAENLLMLEVMKPTAKLVETKRGPVLRISYEFKGLADIFEKRTLNPVRDIDHADSPEEALLASLGTRTVIDWPYMARISGQPAKDLQQALKASGRVYDHPDGSWTLAEEYLSGDVTSKLADVEADGRPQFESNKAALKAVQPAPKTLDDVTIGFGSHWVDTAVVGAYLAHELGVDPSEFTIHLDATETYVRWSVGYGNEAIRAGRQHGLAVPFHYVGEKGSSYYKPTEIYSATDLFLDALNLNQPVVGWWEGRGDNRHYVKDVEGQTAARANVEDIRERWLAWLYTQPATTDKLMKVYNYRFNRDVPRTFDGSHLTLPGNALPFKLYPHQLNAIWRMLTSGNTLLAHEVGAGKTYEMIATAMEWRRTGRARKPMITVPTYLLGQWKASIQQMYPDAKILAFDDKDLSAKKRQQGMARIAFGDWDIVLVPHSSFQLLKTSDERMAEMMQNWIKELSDAEANARQERGQDEASVKKLAAQRKRIERKVAEKLKTVNKGEDNNLRWEDLGVDALMVDEAQAFKNLFFFSKIDNLRGLSKSESDRSLDMYVKVQEINESSNYRNLVLATATPIMNSIAELYTMQRYLQPQTIDQLGVKAFDNWYAMFGDARVNTEQRPDGTYHEVMRLKRYRNLDLLYRTMAQVMDYVGWDDMPYLDLPKLVNDRVRIVKTQPHPMYPEVKKWFATRLQNLRENPPYTDRQGVHHAPDRPHPITGEPTGRNDNILAVMNDAKLAAIDIRLVLGDAATDVPTSRIQTAANLLAENYKKERAYKGVQLVFLDVGTPKTLEPLAFLRGAATEDTTEGAALGTEDEEGETEDDETAPLGDTGIFNLYDALRDALVKRGVRRDEIAYIHQARNAAERKALFDAAESGRIRFLFASTDKGGVGMNIQKRLMAIHHIDAPRAMRPGDMRQRDGRGIRQGNDYKEIDITRYVTEGSTDEWLYGLLGDKSNAITQFMRGNLTEYKEFDPSELSIEEAQIQATGDPRGKRLTELRAATTRLAAQAAAAERAMGKARADQVTHEKLATALRAQVANMETWLKAHYVPVHGDQFAMTVDGTKYTKQADANAAIGEALESIRKHHVTDRVTIGELGHLPMYAQLFGTLKAGYDIQTFLDARPASGDVQYVTRIPVPADAKLAVIEGRNVVASYVSHYTSLAAQPNVLNKEAKESEDIVARSKALLDHPPDAVRKFNDAKEEMTRIETELKAEGRARDAEADAQRKAETEDGTATLERKVPMVSSAQPDERPDPDVKTRADLRKAYKKQSAETIRGVLDAIEHESLEDVEWPAGFPMGIFARYDEDPADPDADHDPVTLDHVREVIVSTLHRLALEKEGQQDLLAEPSKPAKPGSREQFHRLMALRSAGKGLTQAAGAIKSTLAAASMTTPSRTSARYFQWRLAQQAHLLSYAYHALTQYRNAVERMTLDHGQILDIADALQDPTGTGKRVPAELKPWETIRTEIFDHLKQQLKDLGIERDWKDYYLGQAWENEYKPDSVLGQARRPLGGPGSFMRRKKIPTMREGVEVYGKTPITWNLVEMDLHKIAEMAKFVLARQTLEDNKQLGTFVWGSSLRKRPDGMMEIPDIIGKVFAPPELTVHEAYDKGLMEGLESFITQLGVNYTRKATAGTRWGVSGSKSGDIKAKFGGPVEVLMHEVGHTIDTLFDLRTQLLQVVPDAEQELINLAQLRFAGYPNTDPAFRAYVEEPSEQIANLVFGYLYSPVATQQAAPQTYAAFEHLIDSNPQLQMLPDLQQMRTHVFAERTTTQALAGPIYLGQYYAPPEVATVFRRYLEPGLGAHKAWALVRVPSNIMVQAKLSFSAFHGFTVNLASAGMEAARGLNDLARGRPVSAVKRIGRAVIEPAAVIHRGVQHKREYRSTLDTESLAWDAATNLFIAGGGRMEQSRDYTNRAMNKFMDNLRRANEAYIRGLPKQVATESFVAALRLIPAVVEATAWPVLGWLVPVAKAGAMVSQIRQGIDELPGVPTQATLLAIARKASDLTDATLGEVIWDNRALPRVFLNVLQFMIMSPGWRGGSLIILGRGLTDPIRRLVPSQRETYTVLKPPTAPPPPPGGGPAPPLPKQTPRTSAPTVDVKEKYWSNWTSLAIGITLIQVLAAELYQLAHGAGHVGSIADVALPRTGEVNKVTGEPERIKLPGYSAIFYAILHHLPRSLVDYILGGGSPLPTAIGDIYHNSDYGVAIVDEGDPWRVQMRDYAAFMADQLKPISVSSYGRRSGSAVEKAESLVGISPASHRDTMSDAELLMSDYLGPPHLSKEQAERADEKRSIREAKREGTAAPETPHLSPKEAASARKTAFRLPLVAGFPRLSWAQAAHVYEEATPEERGVIRQQLINKSNTERARVPADDKPAFYARKDALLALPFTSRKIASGQ